MPHSSNDNLTDIVRNLVYPTPASANSNINTLLEVLASENDRIDDDIHDLYDNRFLTSATDEELNKMAFEVGVRRQTGETDEELRRRVFSEFAAQASDATYNTFASTVLEVVDAEPENVDIQTPPQSTIDKTVTVFVESAILDESPLTTGQIEDFLEKSNSAGAAVNLSSMGTFAFDGDDTSLEGWNEGTWSDFVGT